MSDYTEIDIQNALEDIKVVFHAASRFTAWNTSFSTIRLHSTE